MLCSIKERSKSRIRKISSKSIWKKKSYGSPNLRRKEPKSEDLANKTPKPSLPPTRIGTTKEPLTDSLPYNHIIISHITIITLYVMLRHHLNFAKLYSYESEFWGRGPEFFISYFVS